MKQSDRAALRPVPLSEVPLTPGHRPPGHELVTVTISVGQPMGAFHRVAYNQGCYLLELNAEEQPVRAYHRGNLQ